MNKTILVLLLLMLGNMADYCQAQEVGKPGFVTNEVMDANDFWDIIEKSKKSGNLEISVHKNSLIKILKRQDIKDIVKFNNRFFSMMDIALDYKLISASNIINKDCNNECFVNFRAWLIVQGKDLFEKAIVNPDILVDVKIPTNFKNADFQFCADDAFNYLVSYPIPLGLQFSKTPHGYPLSENLILTIFPKLLEKFKN